ncbi:MAG: filamentous hemagglutinin N-terminal domain-containing protein [Xenococcus sp. (in: cyanobacteria)]
MPNKKTIMMGSIDLVFGNAEDDQVIGNGVDESLFGGADNDILDGNRGNGVLVGCDSTDSLFGNAANDSLLRNTSDNLLFDSEDNDTLWSVARHFFSQLTDNANVGVEQIQDYLDEIDKFLLSDQFIIGGSEFSHLTITQNYHNTQVKKQGLSLLLSLGYCTFSQGVFLSAATAQVTPDGTTNTRVNVKGNDFTIEQGDRAGGNLFHSFSDFSVPTDGSAFFNNSADIVNIFSRVTGGNISNIDGLIRANGSANLFLLNPSGIIFGENARLDIGGSFLGSTADSIIFPDGEFSALDNQTQPLLTINAPIGLNLRDNPAEIVNRANLIKEERFGEEQIPLIFPNFDTDIPFEEKIVNTLVGLEVNRQQNITLVGGDIILDGGGLTALGGKIQLGGLATAGTITIDSDGNLVFPNNIRLSDISLINDASIDVQGNGGGDIVIIGQNIEVKDGSTIYAGIRAFEGSPDAQAGDIIINGIDTVVFDGVRGENTPRGGANSPTNIANRIGFLLEKEELNIASKFIFEGEFDFAINGEGQAGKVEINTNNLDITNGARITNVNFGRGNLGDIIIDAEEKVNVSNGGSSIFNTIFTGEGNAGNIEVNTRFLNLTDGGLISENTFRGRGNLGNIIINARGNISIDGKSSNPQLPTPESSIFSIVNADGIGNGGLIQIETTNLSLTNQGQLFTSTDGLGNAGDVIINAQENLNISGGKISSGVTQRGEGDGGAVEIKTNDLIVTDNGEINVSSTGTGNVGTITINTNALEVRDRGQILAETNFINPNPEISEPSSINPNISLNIIDGNLVLKGNTLISAKASEQANGGNVEINTDFILAFPQNNDIVASAEQGQGGNINITAEALFGIAERPLNDKTNDINASSDFGLDGSISISTPDINSIKTDTEIPNNLIESQPLGTNACSGSSATETSNFTIKGKGGLRRQPIEPFNSETILIDEEITNSKIQANYPEIKPIETSIGDIYPARGIIKTASGKIILTAYPTDNINSRTPDIAPNCSSS